MTIPSPGRPQSLGAERDTTDGRALVEILRACDAVHGQNSSGALRVAREALWFLWEQPRLPRPLVASKYPLAYPWSPGAQEVFAAGSTRPSGGWGLILEHLTPRRLLLTDLLAAAPDLDAIRLVAHLEQHLVAAVITTKEDRLLTAAGLSHALPAGDPSDPWVRYRAAGLNPDGFKALREMGS